MQGRGPRRKAVDLGVRSFERLEERALLSAAALIRLDEARLAHSQTGAGYTVALIDSGIDYTHPALGGTFGSAGSRVVGGYDFVDGRGGGFVEDDPTPGPDGDPRDANGHGTSIAGIIGAQDPIHPGVAPGVDFVSLRVLDKNNRGSWNWVASALDWVITHQRAYNIAAVNLSLGEGNYAEPPALAVVDSRLETLRNLGVVVVAAAGNEFYFHRSAPGLQYPAISPAVLSVSAVYDADVGSQNWPGGASDARSGADRIAGFAQRGPGLDLLAPGAVVPSTTLSGGARRFASYAGTSQAAGFVTGAAVLVRQTLERASRLGSAVVQQIEQILVSTGKMIRDVESIGNTTPTGMSFPRLDLKAALDEASRPLAPIAPDPKEPNETLSKAEFLGLADPSIAVDRSLHAAGDVDWYRFQVSAEGDYRLSVLADPGALSGTTLAFHNVIKGKEETRSAIVVDGAAGIEVSLRDKANFFLEIRGPVRAVGAYRLMVSRTLSSAGGAAPPPVADRFENNESPLSAPFLGVLSTARFNDLSLHQSSDSDWFRFQVEANGRYALSLSSLAPAGLRITFFDVTKSRERTIVADLAGGAATIDVTLRSKVNYFVKIESPTGSILRYSFEAALSGPQGAGAPTAAMVDAAFGDPDLLLGDGLRARF